MWIYWRRSRQSVAVTSSKFWELDTFLTNLIWLRKIQLHSTVHTFLQVVMNSSMSISMLAVYLKKNPKDLMFKGKYLIVISMLILYSINSFKNYKLHKDVVIMCTCSSRRRLWVRTCFIKQAHMFLVSTWYHITSHVKYQWKLEQDAATIFPGFTFCSVLNFIYHSVVVFMGFMDSH